MKKLLIILFPIAIGIPFCLNAQMRGAGAIMSSVNDHDALDFLLSTHANISNSTQRCAVNELSKQMKGNSVWSLMQVIYPMVGGTATAHSYNLRLTSSAQLTFVNTPTQSSNGVDWDGTTQYAKSVGYSPNNLITSKTACALGYYTKDDATTRNSTSEIGATMSSGAFSAFGIRIGYTANAGTSYSQFAYLFSPSADATATTTSTVHGFYIASRNGTAVSYYKDGTSIASGTTTVNAQNVTTEIYLGAFSFGASATGYSDKQCAFAFVYNGSLSSTQVTNLNTIVSQYQTILGR